jgi:hypothetical protein
MRMLQEETIEKISVLTPDFGQFAGSFRQRTTGCGTTSTGVWCRWKRLPGGAAVNRFRRFVARPAV